MPILQNVEDHNARIALLEQRVEMLGQLLQKLGDLVGVEVSSLLPPQAVSTSPIADQLAKYGGQTVSSRPF